MKLIQILRNYNNKSMMIYINI